MHPTLKALRNCVERGKVERSSVHPSDMKDQEGASELMQKALKDCLSPQDIMTQALISGMHQVGERFRNREIFVPDVLMAAKAMSKALEYLRPHFESQALAYRGTMVLGTVMGDLHDIGKKLVGLILQGAGWNVVDLGVDVSAEKFLEAVEKNTNCVVGLSALLTTTMLNMKEVVEKIQAKFPKTTILVGGAPVTHDFAREINASAYCADPQDAVEFLTKKWGSEARTN